MQVSSRKMIQAMAFVFTGSLATHNVFAATNAISGSQCQAKDESALAPGSLIRSTFGITNKSNKIINVYCPVDATIAGAKLKFDIKYTVSDRNYETKGVDVVVAKNLDCKLAFNRKKAGANVNNRFQGDRKYNTFRRSRFAIEAVTSTVLKSMRTLSDDPVIIKCKLRPGDQIKSIHSAKAL